MASDEGINQHAITVLVPSVGTNPGGALLMRESISMQSQC